MGKVSLLIFLLPIMSWGQGVSTQLSRYVMDEGGGIAGNGVQPVASKADITIGQALQGETAGPGGRLGSGYYNTLTTPTPVITATLDIEPNVLNLKSKGEAITAKLRLDQGASGCFKRETIRISAVNGLKLPEPIYALQERGEDRDKHKDSKEQSKYCGFITVKFDRERVIEILPVNAVSVISVTGVLDAGRAFDAEDAVRTIKPKRVSRREKWRFEHHKHACIDGPDKAFNEDSDVYLLSVDKDIKRREALKEAAAKTARFSRNGQAYELGPDEIKFDKPVTISLPYDGDNKSPEKLAVAYWSTAASAWELLSSTRDAEERLLKADVSQAAQYQVVSATYAVSGVPADKSFKLGEVYVSPNPAMGGKKPVFHVECGIADRVSIKVLSVTGMVVHEKTLTEIPQVKKGEKGPVYVYEYAWEGRGGMYYYTVEAEKSGEKLKAQGGFAVMK